jgi:hypothetical protein
LKRIINRKTARTGALLLAALFSTSAAPLPAKRTAGLQLTAKLTSSTDLSYQITKNGKEAAALGVWFCEKSQNWSTDSPAVKVVWPEYRGCDKEACSPREFKKGEALAGSLKIQFMAGAKVAYFRLHFKSCIWHPGKQPVNMVDDLWSEPISAQIKNDGG